MWQLERFLQFLEHQFHVWLEYAEAFFKLYHYPRKPSFLVQTHEFNLLIDPIWSKWLKVIKRLKRPGTVQIPRGLSGTF